MGVLKGFLYFCSIAFALAAVLVLAMLPWHTTYLPAFWIIKLILLAVLGGLAYVVFGQAKKFGVQADASMSSQFEATVRRIADKNGGVASLSAIVGQTGETQAGAQQKMRHLMGRGVCELDFGPNGEEQYKLTPTDEARANLARSGEKV